MKKKVTPLGNNVLVKVLKEEGKTKSGLYIPETASKEKPQEGEIVAMGDGEKINSKLRIGSKVLYKKYMGSELEIEKEDYLMLNGKDDILAIVE